MFVEVLPQVAETFKAPENSQFLTHDRYQSMGQQKQSMNIYGGIL